MTCEALAGTWLPMDRATRVEFGPGSLDRLTDIVVARRTRRALVVTDQGLRAIGMADRVHRLLHAAGVAVEVYDEVTPNPGLADLRRGAARARELTAHASHSVVVALGGGSVLDAAKGIALLAMSTDDGLPGDGLPVVAVPTTAGTGAETNGFGVIEDEESRVKVYVGHPSVRPFAVVLDPELTVGLPPAATAATGMDALVHGIESLASLGATAESAAYARQAVTLVSGSIARAVDAGDDLDARARMLLGAHLAGRALSLSGLGLVHGIGHAVTTHTGAAHGLALTAVLSEVMQESEPAARGAYAAVADAMSLPGRNDSQTRRAESAVAAVRELAEQVGARHRLQHLGVSADMTSSIAQAALADAVTRNHPVQVPVARVRALIADRM